MTKIVVTQELGLFPDQIARLQKLGDVTFHDQLAESYEAWVERVQGYDVICSGKFGSSKNTRICATYL